MCRVNRSSPEEGPDRALVLLVFRRLFVVIPFVVRPVVIDGLDHNSSVQDAQDEVIPKEVEQLKEEEWEENLELHPIWHEDAFLWAPELGPCWNGRLFVHNGPQDNEVQVVAEI